MTGKIVIGANTIIVKDGKLLLGLRKGAYGAGDWGLPGGHLEAGEKLEDAARRELLEETGIVASELHFESVVNQAESSEHHYIQITFSVLSFSGEPLVCEPKKCEAWKWFPLEALPENVFRPHMEPISLFKKKVNFSDKTSR